MDLFPEITVFSSGQATLLPFLPHCLATDRCRVIRVGHPVCTVPNRGVVGHSIEAGGA
jgi:hypothetical protein